MKMSKVFLFLIIYGSVFNTLIFAGAWTQKKNGYFFKISGNYLYTDKEFNHEGEKLNIQEERIIYANSSFRDINLELYYEFGLTDYLTIIGKLPYKSLTTKHTLVDNYLKGDQIATTSGFSDLELSSKIGILNDPLVLSFEGGIKVPMGYSQKPTNDGPRLGSGDIDLEGHLWFGKGLYPIPAYITGSFGYIHRTDNLHDQILFTIETGYTLSRFTFKVYFELLRSTVDPPDIYGQPIETPIEGGGGVLPEILVGDQDYDKLFPSISYKIKENLSVQAELWHVLSGKNSLSGTTFSIGLIFHR